MNKQLWNKALRRALIGMPIGLLISTVITIIISLCKGDGHYYAVVPALIEDCGSEINAVLIQFICSLLYGAVFAGATVIWETDWSLTKMTAVHFLICSAATFPTAYLMRWMNHSVGGVLGYFVQFVAIYVVIWVASYFATKKKIEAFNRKIGAKA